MSKSFGKDAENTQSATFREKLALRYVERVEKLKSPRKIPSPNETTNPLKKLKLQPVIKQTESGNTIPPPAISEKVVLRYVERVEKLKSPRKIPSSNETTNLLKKLKLQPVIKQTESGKTIPPPAISEKVALRYVEGFEKLKTPTKIPSPNETTTPLKKSKLQPVIKQTESGKTIPPPAISEKVALSYVEGFEKLKSPRKIPSPNETTNPLKKLKFQPVIKQAECGKSIPPPATSEKVALRYIERVEKLKSPRKIPSPNETTNLINKLKLQPFIKQAECGKSIPPPAILKHIQNKKFANVNSITSTFKLEKVTRLRRIPKQFAKIIIHEKELPLRAMAKCVDQLNDSKMMKALSIQKPVILKEEVVDLTDDSCGLTVHINFAVINVIQQFDMQQCEDLFQEAKLLKSELVHFDQVIVTQPPSFDPNPIPVVDLIEDSDTEADCKFVIQQSINNNNHNNLPIVTVSDCIDFILPIVYRFYKLCKLNKRTEDALIEANSSNVNSFTDDFSKKKISIGADLVRYLSKITILKFDFNNFIDTLYTSFKEKYKEFQLEKTTFIAHLSSMVEKNRSYCKSDVSITIVDGIKILKEETEVSVLSRQQLETLRKQLQQYHDIVLNQRRLMAAAFTSHPELYDTLMFYPQSEIFSRLKD